MFKNDLVFGKRFELELLKFLEHDSYEQSIGVEKGWDICTKKLDFDTLIINTYEVKADRISNRTGNLCIEYHCNNKDSGITTSIADYWAYFVVKEGFIDYDLYIIPTRKIRKYIRLNKYKINIHGGDKKRSKMYIFDINTFNKYKFN